MSRVLVIAEAGVNHNGDLNVAKRLIKAAAEAGADFVKFQTFSTKRLVTKSVSKAEYQLENTTNASDQSQFEMLKNLELSAEDHSELMAYCKAEKIQFLSAAFDLESIDLLLDLKVPLFKIPSGEITNLPYLRKIGTSNKPIVMSTGMATMEEVRQALEALIQSGAMRKDVTILHCNTAYPTPFKDVNLAAMQSIKAAFGTKVGYSDHTLGIEVPIASVALGASVIEKHLTLDRTMDGPDHAASLEPGEFRKMVEAIRNIEISLGDGEKKPSSSEVQNIKFARKSIHLARSMKKGERLELRDLVMKRPGDGISPMKVDEIVGKQLMQDLPEDQLIKWEDLT